MTWKKGQSGNPRGRPKGSYSKFRSGLWKALREEAKEQGTTFEKHVAQQALKDNSVLLAVIKGYLPALKAIELTGDGTGPQASITLVINDPEKARSVSESAKNATIELSHNDPLLLGQKSDVSHFQ